MSTHYREVCQYGLVHGQCRCPGPRVDRAVQCSTPELHRPRDPVNNDGDFLEKFVDQIAPGGPSVSSPAEWARFKTIVSKLRTEAEEKPKSASPPKHRTVSLSGHTALYFCEGVTVTLTEPEGRKIPYRVVKVESNLAYLELIDAHTGATP